MPKLNDYECTRCNTVYEYLLHGEDKTPICPKCASTEHRLEFVGGHQFKTIIPTYPGAKKRKAGYVHNYTNKPAEKAYISVPKKI